MARTSACLNDAVMFDFVEGRLADEATKGVERHLAGCADCSTVVAELARFRFQSQPPTVRAAGSGEPDATGAPPATEDAAPLAAGTVVSRYMAGAVIGVGGGGVVQEAYDPQLRRRVALKLLRPLPRQGLDAREIEQRLLLEAQAMAQLAHPNVVYVFDAGVFEGRVFIVMELVEGETLSDWLAHGPRSRPEILEVFIAAGRGLAAAHARGIIHGDFKPQNVLVDAEGRARVSDFGLAHSTLPETGALISGGTPAFMAPEQKAGRSDMRSDQYSFCVALFMALYGHHPGSPGRPPPARDRVHVLLLRGLAVDPDDRHASMDALLGELARPRHPAVRRAALIATPLVLLLGALGWRQVHAARCGNGVTEAGEECDDGNARDDDACLPACRWARCGDGKLRAGVEECDDGNTRDGDGCSSSCLRCARGATSFTWAQNGHCYSRHDEPTDWTAARNRCIAEGADLVSYMNPAESTVVVDRLLRGTTAGHWIGLLRQPHQQDFTWVGGNPWTSNLKEWWAQTAKAPDRDCVFEVATTPTTSNTGLVRHSEWPTAACTEPHGFLCEQSTWQIFPLNNHAYRFDDRPTQWPDAQRRCKAAGGHLVTIGDEVEQKFVAAIANAPSWIGATDEAEEGHYRWVDGTPFRYTAFAAGEPDQGRRANCLVLDVEDTWHDRHCDKTIFGFICEMD